MTPQRNFLMLLLLQTTTAANVDVEISPGLKAVYVQSVLPSPRLITHIPTG